MKAPRQKPRDIEGPIHRSILDYLRRVLPGAVIMHAPNELQIGHKGTDAERLRLSKAKAIAQNRAKALGMLPGFPDLLVIWRGHVWGLEVKGPGKFATDEQRHVGALIEHNGGRWAVVRSIDDAADCITRWRRGASVGCGNSPLTVDAAASRRVG